MGIVAALIVTAIGFSLDKLDGLLDNSSSQREVEQYCDLLSPLIVQFDRTLDAFQRYRPHDFALEQTLEDGNRKAREILEANAQLIPTSLDEDRQRLVQHYDIWLEEYARVRQIGADSVTSFIFVGPDGFPFPRDSEQRFRAWRDTLASQLGNTFSCRTG